MGGIPKWMVYKGTSHLEMDDLGVPPISGNHHCIFAASVLILTCPARSQIDFYNLPFRRRRKLPSLISQGQRTDGWGTC